ncbi:MBL fold metallo-hydrolase [Nonomuraea sp. NPDC026600]|uniref:MBL fold metallo-hydrolase n=1 Tax=Nonomuraea sp. NPDC026600 TaxID=3155363 RepID=UPI0033EC1D98
MDTGHVGRRSLLIEMLAARGIVATDIDMVVLSHAHWDHIQNVDLFDRADILLHRHELRYLRNPHPADYATPPWTGRLFTEERLRVVADGEERASGVNILAAPGHSAGSLAVAVATADGLAVIAADAIQNGIVAATRRNIMVFWNAEQADRTVARLMSYADVIYPGHDHPFRLNGRDIEYLDSRPINVTRVPGQAVHVEKQDDVQPWLMPGIEQQGAPRVSVPARGRGFILQSRGARRRIRLQACTVR